MFWKRYHQSFPVRMEIIANNAIVVFCHLVEVAIFTVTNFFSLFGIAIFNIPITHIIMFLLFLMQRYNLFPYLQIFFNFFHFWRLDLSIITNFVFMPVVLCSSLFRWCVPVVFRWCAGRGRVSWCLFSSIIHTRTHTRAHGDF